MTHIGTGGPLVPKAYRNNGRPVPKDWLGGGENIRSKDYMGIGYWPYTFFSMMALDGVFEKFPALRGASIEQGAEWVPTMMRTLDHAQNMFKKNEPDLQALPMQASDYIRRQVKFTPFPKEDVRWITDNIGPDLLMFSTDYPHLEGGHDPLKNFSTNLAGQPEDVLDKFYTANFARAHGPQRRGLRNGGRLMSIAAAPVARMTREDRRDQLLDAAAEIVSERGIGAITMEGLAEQAGVSKALPYQHFDNADAALVALYQREINHLGGRVFAAVATISEPEDRVRAAIHAYFDVVEERGALLGALSSPGAGVASRADQRARVGVEFVAVLLVKPFGITGRKSRMLASMFLAMLGGALDSWAHGDGGRDRIEQAVAALIVAGLRDARERELESAR